MGIRRALGAAALLSLAACTGTGDGGSSADPESTASAAAAQPTGGEGWRLLGVQDAGEPLDTGVATTDEQLSALWDAAGLPGAPLEEPQWEDEVVLLVVPTWSTGCPVRLTGFAVDGDHVRGEYDRVTGGCRDDLRPRAFVAAFERSHLPGRPFTLRAQEGQSPSLVKDDPTQVEVDLTVPGSTLPGT